MKLKRLFIDTKRILVLSVNYFQRTKWLIDFIQAISPALDYINKKNIKVFNRVGDVVKFTGQKLSLKTFIDDKYDIIERRTLIDENREESYGFYGYKFKDEWKSEIDSNPTSLNGYYNFDTKLYTLEDPIEENPIIYGFLRYLNRDALKDVELEYILDSYFEFIYTLENQGDSIRRHWFLEKQAESTALIKIHNTIYNNMTVQEKEALQIILRRYVIEPIRFEIDGYS